ncbi:hypothetical protein AK812_SmicGene40245 [Symbiodinium microadriaticum]|uniref:Uncharacterized protein n=1 Tax=Symbiodinium microadriaticum TaxID=2951 RepID=A0A1Q9C968_SYMMI|nr:hypothetical protein AK812_SmicGene40245 [Symbiodinium microadriaticum]
MIFDSCFREGDGLAEGLSKGNAEELGKRSESVEGSAPKRNALESTVDMQTGEELTQKRRPCKSMSPDHERSYLGAVDEKCRKGQACKLASKLDVWDSDVPGTKSQHSLLCWLQQAELRGSRF